MKLILKTRGDAETDLMRGVLITEEASCFVLVSMALEQKRQLLKRFFEAELVQPVETFIAHHYPALLAGPLHNLKAFEEAAEALKALPQQYRDMVQIEETS